MIKINLLPIRSSKKKETQRQQALILLASIIGVVLVCLAVYAFFILSIGSIKDEITNSEQELAELQIKIGKIKDLEKLKADVSTKLDVLNQLRREKVGPVNRLMTVSNSVPEKLWLTRYSESGTVVSVSGVAFSEELIAGFMKSLESSADFSDVELIVSEQLEMSGLKLKRFELKFNLQNKGV